MYNLSTPAPVALTVHQMRVLWKGLPYLQKKHWKRHRKTFMGSKVNDNGPSFSQAFYTKEKEEENIPIKSTIKYWFLFYYWAKNTNISFCTPGQNRRQGRQEGTWMSSGSWPTPKTSTSCVTRKSRTNSWWPPLGQKTCSSTCRVSKQTSSSQTGSFWVLTPLW